MASYKVTWEIDIDADNPREAALEAVRIMAEETSVEGDSVSGPVFFEVREIGDGGSITNIDLECD